MYTLQDATLYDAAMEIKYLDMVVNEVLRIFPPGPRYIYHTRLYAVNSSSHSSSLRILIIQSLRPRKF